MTGATRYRIPASELLTQIGQSAAALAVWGLSRILIFRLWSERERYIDFDVRYYHWQLINLGVDQALVEYPTPIPVLLEAIRRTVGADEQGFVLGFAAVMAIVDLAAACWLWFGYSRLAAAYWAGFTGVIGALAWYRIDLLPAVAVLASLAWLSRRPISSGVAVAIGAATKLWPAMLIFPLLGRDRAAQLRALGFGVVGLGLGALSLYHFGWARSSSPLTWQSDRGLQIESVLATVPMLRRTFIAPGEYSVVLSQYNAWQISGPQVEAWLGIANWLMVGCVLLAAVFGWLIGLGGIGLPGHRLLADLDAYQSARRTHAIVLAQLAMICAVIVVNKTFSPQYLIWLGGPLAVLVSLPLPSRDRAAAVGLGIMGLICAGLTHMVFPLNYTGLLVNPAETRATWLLVVRNLAMVLLTLAATIAALRAALRWQRTE